VCGFDYVNDVTGDDTRCIGQMEIFQFSLTV